MSEQLSTEELLQKWREAIKDRDQAVSRRMDNMFLGPVGLEERAAMDRADLSMVMWFLNRLIELEAAREKQT